jgi:hypothetical protein
MEEKMNTNEVVEKETPEKGAAGRIKKTAPVELKKAYDERKLRREIEDEAWRKGFKFGAVIMLGVVAIAYVGWFGASSSVPFC